MKVLLWGLLAALTAGTLIWAGPRFYAHFELAAWGYAVKGIDVSHYQGEIDWQGLRAGGVRFAYIKATEGAHYRDPRFAGNWRRSRDAGIPRGAYHFFSMCKPGAEQAANFIAAIPAGGQSLPHALDAEQMEACPNSQAVADPVAEILAFLDGVREALRPQAIDLYDPRVLRHLLLKQGPTQGTPWQRALLVPQPPLGAPVRQQSVDAMAIP